MTARPPHGPLRGGVRRLVGAGVALLAFVTLPAGCGKSHTPDADATTADDAAASGAPKKRMPGVVRWNDETVPFGTLVLHNPDTDLRTQCRLLRDDEVKAGKPSALCYDEAPRARTAVKTIRVEHGTARVGAVFAMLRGKHEGAHFLVERDGAAYQLLDMVFAARRDGAPRPEEIRVLSMAPEADQAFVAALKVLFPEADVVKVPLELSAPAPPAEPAAPPADADTTGGEDATAPRHFDDDDTRRSAP